MKTSNNNSTNPNNKEKDLKSMINTYRNDKIELIEITHSSNKVSVITNPMTINAVRNTLLKELNNRIKLEENDAIFEEALGLAKENAASFPQFESEGRTWITINGQSYPKDWFIYQAARMKAEGEI